MNSVQLCNHTPCFSMSVELDQIDFIFVVRHRAAEELLKVGITFLLYSN